MPSPDLLESAGQRAAFRPVPMPPSIDDLSNEVDRRRVKKRRIGGAVAALALVVALPVGASFVGDDQPDVVTFASEDGDADQVSDSAVALQPADTTTTTEAPTTTEPPSTDDAIGPFAGMSDENFDLSLKFGETSISIEVITGGDAAQRAAAAESSADRTRIIDDETIWLDEQGDEVTASAFFDDETFVAVTGAADDVDQILDLVTEHANGPVQFFDHDQFAERFDLPEGIFKDGFTFDEDFPFGEDGPFGAEGPFGEDFPFDAESFFDEGALDEFRKQMDEFSTCMNITVDRSGSSTKIEIPDCDLPSIDGLVSPGAFGDLFDDDFFADKDLDDLFDDLDDVLEDAS